MEHAQALQIPLAQNLWLKVEADWCLVADQGEDLLNDLLL